MKVGVLQFFSWPERRVPLNTVYERALQRIDVMDRTGYDAVWLAEHHFNSFSVCPSVHLMGMHVADRTSNLRIGMAITLAAFYHPLRIAEEVALLDVLSGGRVNWGAGRGFDPTEYRVFGVTPEDSYPRFREHVDIVQRAWTDGRLTYQGEHWQFDNVEVLPKPLQQPHPPMWLAAGSPEAVEWSAKQGYTIMMDPHASHREIGRKRQLYEDTLVAAGHSMEGRQIPMARLLAVAPTRAEAEDVARRGASWIVAAYANPGRQAIVSPTVTEAGPPGHQVDPVQRYVDDVVMWGTPEEVTDQIAELRESISLDYLMCAPLSHSTFEMFTERVMPKLI
jgi:alkanesulfonate monooxygenase SsuD/methylene tetrahydromethanopterin reductase-like flavin-dependent oxidoreductase (luciferase family)